MRKRITHCPYCGTAFAQNTGRTDSRYPSGYECDNCNEMLEIMVNQFPLA